MPKSPVNIRVSGLITGVNLRNPLLESYRRCPDFGRKITPQTHNTTDIKKNKWKIPLPFWRVMIDKTVSERKAGPFVGL